MEAQAVSQGQKPGNRLVKDVAVMAYPNNAGIRIADPIAQRLGWTPGMRVTVTARDDQEIIIRPARNGQSGPVLRLQTPHSRALFVSSGLVRQALGPTTPTTVVRARVLSKSLVITLPGKEAIKPKRTRKPRVEQPASAPVETPAPVPPAGFLSRLRARFSHI